MDKLNLGGRDSWLFHTPLARQSPLLSNAGGSEINAQTLCQPSWPQGEQHSSPYAQSEAQGALTSVGGGKLSH